MSSPLITPLINHHSPAMTTIYERTSEGIIYRPPQDRTWPQLDLLTFLFGQWRLTPGADVQMITDTGH